MDSSSEINDDNPIFPADSGRTGADGSGPTDAGDSGQADTGDSGETGAGESGQGESADSGQIDNKDWQPLILGSSSIDDEAMLQSEELGERPMVVITPQLGSLTDSSSSNDSREVDEGSPSGPLDDSTEVEWSSVIETAPSMGLQPSNIALARTPPESHSASGINLVSSLHDSPEESALEGDPSSPPDIDATPQQLLNAALQHFGCPGGIQKEIHEAALKAAASQPMPGMSHTQLATIATPPSSLGTSVSTSSTPLSAGRSPLVSRRTPIIGAGSSSDQPLELSDDDSDDEIPTSFIRIPQLPSPLPMVNPNPPLPLGHSSSQLPYPLPTVQAMTVGAPKQPKKKKAKPKKKSISMEGMTQLRGGHGKSQDASSNRVLLTGEQRLAIAQYVEMTGFSHKDVAENFANQWNIRIVPSTVYRALKKYTTLKAAGTEPTAKNMAAICNEYEETDKLAMALYASKHGATEAARVFSEKLGFCINESTVRGFVKKKLGKMKLHFLEDQPQDPPPGPEPE